MLRLITGKAGTGKTALIIKEIAEHVRRGEGRDLLIVAEQYSHEAERELCLACGDSMSLTAEVFSFTGLARRIMSELGGEGRKYLDKGGRMLCMTLALDAVGSRLKLYSGAGRRAELRQTLLSAVDELKSACVNEEMLRAAALKCSGGLQNKLLDLALIMESYDAVVGSGRLDPSDRLTILARQIPESSIDENTRMYIDGFTDFTGQELEIIKALMKKGADISVCLTYDEGSRNEIFASAGKTALTLTAFAKERGIKVSVHPCTADAQLRPAAQLAENMFSYSGLKFEAPEGAVRLFTAASASEECELAAAESIRLVRETGCRWRDIAIAVRGFEDYRAVLESCFSHYGVPLYTARKSSMLSRPLPAFISAVYELVSTGWDVDDVIAFLHTELTGLDTAESDLLEKYVYIWQLRESAWRRPDDWHQHPDGFGGKYDDAVNKKLERINAARRSLAGPLLIFEQRARVATTASEQASALSLYFEEAKLPQVLEKRAEELREAGRAVLAGEYEQLWELCVSALEQCAAILGDMKMDMQSFGKLYQTVLTQYDIGTIPVSLDRVIAGDFDRMRRRSIKHLIVLGCTDDRIPLAEKSSGAFTTDERRKLLDLDIDIRGGSDMDLFHEFSTIYNCLTLPSESICLCRPLSAADGNTLRPSIVFGRAKAMFGVDEQCADMEELRMSAKGPALTLAACSMHDTTAKNRAAAEYFEQNEPELFKEISAAAEMKRGALSPEAVEALYGRKIRLSASKIDTLAACRFEYFCRYGMNAKEYEPAGFKPPEIGTFIHYVLENTAREVKEIGGWKQVTDETLNDLCDKYIDEYIKVELNGFSEKTARFVYLFNRLKAEVHTIVDDMATELRRSDFEPLLFEFDFASKDNEANTLQLPESFGNIMLTGIADRIDGCEMDGKLYLRVVDYKSGKKTFSFEDVWYGKGLQMLLYLYTLCENPQLFEGRELVPAGVMYVPAKQGKISNSGDMTDEEIEKKRLKDLRRSGIVLENDALLDAWENGDEKSFIPIRFNKSGPKTDFLVSAERFEKLYSHIVDTLGELSAELRAGDIAAMPLYKSASDNACKYCPYTATCGFTDGENDEHCRVRMKITHKNFWELIDGKNTEEEEDA